MKYRNALTSLVFTFSIFSTGSVIAKSIDNIQLTQKSCCPGPCCPEPALNTFAKNSNINSQNVLEFLKEYKIKAEAKRQEALSS